MAWPFNDRRKALMRERETLALELEVADLRAKAAVANSSGSTASYPLSDPLAFEKVFGPRQDTVSAETAMTHGAVYRCVFLIAGTIAMLDFDSYANVGTPDEIAETGSVQARLLGERPNPRYSRTAFWRSVLADMLLNGNGIVWIERNRAGIPQNLWWIPWGRCGIHFWKNPLGVTELRYHLTLDDGQIIVAAQDDVMHFGGSHSWNLFYYHSPLTAYALTVGIGISADRYAKAYFDNGFSADSVISYPANMTPEKAKEIRAKLHDQLGKDRRFSGPVVLDGGAKLDQLKINATDSQLLESRAFNNATIGMVFGVPSHLLNETTKTTSFGRGLEELTQSFIDFTLGPHLAMIEDEVNFKLYGQRTKRARFDRDSFIRGDLKSRADALQTLLGGAQGPGVLSQNEARSRINMPRRPDPDCDVILGWGTMPDGASAPAAPPANRPAPPAAKPST